MRKTTGWSLSGATMLAFVAAITLAGLAFAQETAPAGQQPTPAPQEEPQAEEGRTEFVEEVIVTAQKRTEDVQEVPVAITAVLGQDLGVIMAGGPDIRFLSARVPSLTLESSFGRAFPRFYMRGLGNTDFDLNASQPVSMLVDEVVLENPVVKGMPLFDLDRVEILRGPQGTLFGRNTPGRRDQVRDQEAVAGVRGGLPAVVRHVRHHRLLRRRRRRAHRHDLGALLGVVPVAQRLGRQRTRHRRGGRARRLRHHRVPPAVPLRAQRQVQRRCSTSTAGSSTAPRASSAPTSSSTAPTIWSTTSSRTPSTTTASTSRRSRRWAACSRSTTTSAPPP